MALALDEFTCYGRDIVADIWRTTFSSAFSWMKIDAYIDPNFFSMIRYDSMWKN